MKKLFAILMSIMMIACFMPSMAFAAASATVADVTISGTQNAKITDQEVTVTLEDDTFEADLSGNWITNLPAGLSQSVSRTDDTTAKITISGTPTAVSDAAITIKIVADQLVTSSEDLNVTSNA